MPDWLEQAIGACLVLVVLLDVFLTVLYARIGTASSATVAGRRAAGRGDRAAGARTEPAGCRFGPISGNPETAVVLGLDSLVLDPSWREASLGSWEGKAKAELDAAEYQAWRAARLVLFRATGPLRSDLPPERPSASTRNRECPEMAQGSTLAVFPHCWAEQTLRSGLRATELDPKQSFRQGSALKVPYALNPVKGHDCSR